MYTSPGLPQKPSRDAINTPVSALDGDTYLHKLCAMKAPVELIKEAVFSLGADVQALNRFQVPPLGVAIAGGDLRIIRCLIEECRAELFFSVGGKPCFNAAATAVLFGREDALRVILDNGGGAYVNVPWPDAGGLCCLSLAILQDRLCLVDALLATGAFLSREEGGEKMTPLHRAAHLGDRAMIKKLFEAGAALDQRQSASGMTALHYAASSGKFYAIDYLLQQGADPNAVTAAGLTPLMLAIMSGSSVMSLNAALVSRLIDGGADVNYQRPDNPKDTALHFAAARGDNDSVVTLLRSGADPLLADAFNRTAARAARIASYSALANKLDDAARKAEQAFFEKHYQPPPCSGTL